MADLVAAVDAGNSKIDALLVDTDGRVHARARGGPFRPQIDGVAPSIAELAAVMTRLMDRVDGPTMLASGGGAVACASGLVGYDACAMTG